MAKQTIKAGNRVRVIVTARSISSTKIVNGQLVVTYSDADVEIVGSVPNAGKPTPTPTPAPTPAPTPSGPVSRITVTGDSWTVDYGGYYAGAYKELRQNVYTFSMQGVGGSGLNDLVARESAVIASAPDLLHIGIGRNDLNTNFPYDTDQKWLDALWAHIGRIRAALPNVRVMVETLCAEQQPSVPQGGVIYNNRRGNINAAIRAAVGTRIYGVIDFAASSEIGDDADMIPQPASPTTISTDGLHLYDRSTGGRTGHDIAFEIYTAAMDAAAGYVNANALTIVQTSARGSKPFAWYVQDSASLRAGDFWNAQRATTAANLSAGVLNGQAVQQITMSDLAGGDVTLTDLSATPSGPLALRVRTGREDGQGGYVWGGWSNVLTDVIS